MRDIECSNCGARYDQGMLHCPYCKGENYKEADRIYKQELKTIEEQTFRLRQLPHKIAEFASKHVTLLIIIGVIVLSAGFMMMQLFQAAAARKQHFDAKRNEQVLEAYFIQEQYEEMTEYLYEVNSYEAVYKKYTETARAYEKLQSIRKSKAALNGDREDYRYGIKDALYYGDELLKQAGSEVKDHVLRGNEAVLQRFIDESYAYFYEDLHLTEKERLAIVQYDFMDPIFNEKVEEIIVKLGLE